MSAQDGRGHPGQDLDAPKLAPRAVAPPSRPSPVTRSVRAGIGADAAHRAVMPPLHLASNYLFQSPGVYERYDYTRTANPTRDLAAAAIADLEGGAGAVVTSSGMAAVVVATRLLSAGDLLVAPHDCYGGCHRLFAAEQRRGAYRVRFVDQTRPDALEEVRAARPQMIWLETPSNPLMRIADIAAWARLAREVGAWCVADNTFLSPVNQRPLSLGVHIVVHSTTKFINGHSDVVGGAAVAHDEGVHEQLAWWANALGVTGAPFDSFLTLRGIRTLHARSRVHEENALRVVDVLRRRSDVVERVNHPSLPDHPGHETARAQQLGWGSLLSFELRGGRAAAEAFVDGLRHFALAESLGGVESLVSHPWTMTHASMDETARVAAGIGEGLLRLSVGIESPEDLEADLEQALGRAAKAAGGGLPRPRGSSTLGAQAHPERERGASHAEPTGIRPMTVGAAGAAGAQVRGRACKVGAALVGCALVGCLDEPWPVPEPVDEPVLHAEHEQWRAERRESLVDPTGGGAVLWSGLWELAEGPTPFGSDSSLAIVLPAEDSPALAGTLHRTGDQVRLLPAPGGGVGLRDGDPVAAPLLLENDRSDSTTVLSLGSLGLRIHAERGTSRLWLRAWDTDSPKRQSFQLPPHYPVRNDWRVAARLEPYPEPRTFDLADVTDGTVQNISPGELTFRSAGRLHRLVAFATESSRNYFVMLWDSTALSATYQGGRYMRVPLADEDGRTVIDFNRAYNPPCVFTPYSVCSLPPPESRLALTVEAGEKRPDQFR